ncbi:unnamed protein product [Aphanomyces euteiches]
MHTSTTPTATAAASVRAERAVVPPPPVLLSLAEVDVIQTAARRQCKTQVRQTQVLNGPIRWRLLADENELKICKGRLRTQPSTTVEPPFYLSVVEVAATLDEVIDVFRTDTTQHAKAYTRRFAKDVVGATTLATLTTPGLIDQPLSETHIVVSWVARKQHPASWLRHNQDMCLIEVRSKYFALVIRHCRPPNSSKSMALRAGFTLRKLSTTENTNGVHVLRKRTAV